MFYICHITNFYIDEIMTDETRYIKIKLLSKWLNDISKEIVNNKTLDDEDLIGLLMSMKNTISELDKEIEIMIGEITKNKKSQK